MAGTGTWGNVGTTDPDKRIFVAHMIDASGDTWTEQLIVAIAATLTAIQAWMVLYQTATQASIYEVEEQRKWIGAADVGNATFLARSGIEQGINMSFFNSTTFDLFPLRVVAPVPDDMQGANDIPDMASDELTNLVTSTLALSAGYDFKSAQYTGRRERKNNPRVIG